jgi:hypothetical protein
MNFTLVIKNGLISQFAHSDDAVGVEPAHPLVGARIKEGDCVVFSEILSTSRKGMVAFFTSYSSPLGEKNRVVLDRDDPPFVDESRHPVSPLNLDGV